VLPAAGKENKTDFPTVSAVAAPTAPVVDKKEQKRQDAEQRQRVAALKKPIENKLKRLDEQIAKRNEQKADVDAKLGEPGVYEAANKAKLKTLLADQSFYTKDLAQLEGEWLELQEQLEAVV
jgi:ATP-binding cassette subfamily F protein 3